MLNICLVGFKGYWSKFLERTFTNTQGVKITTYVDAAAKNQLTDIPYITDSLERALDFAGHTFDAVVIATPPHTHYEIAKSAICAGKHVMIEKPMATCSIHAKEINELAKLHGVKVAVDHTFLFSNQIRVMKQMIQAGEIGKVFRIVSNRHHLGKFQDSGVVWDLMPHDIAMTNYLMEGKPTVKNVEFLRHLHNEVVDTARISLRYEDVSCELNLSWLYPKKIRTTVVIGSKGMIEYDMLSDSQLKLYDKRAEKGNTAWEHSFNWISEYQGESREPLQVLAEEFRDHCLLNKNFPSKGDLGLEVVECIEETLKAESL